MRRLTPVAADIPPVVERLERVASAAVAIGEPPTAPGRVEVAHTPTAAELVLEHVGDAQGAGPSWSASSSTAALRG